MQRNEEGEESAFEYAIRGAAPSLPPTSVTLPPTRDATERGGTRGVENKNKTLTQVMLNFVSRSSFFVEYKMEATWTKNKNEATIFINWCFKK